MKTKQPDTDHPSITIRVEMLEAEMIDTTKTSQERVLIAIRRLAWGNQSDYAVMRPLQATGKDSEPKPVNQEMLAEILSLAPSTISKACSLFRKSGYLNPTHPFLMPERSPRRLQ